MRAGPRACVTFLVLALVALTGCSPAPGDAQANTSPPPGAASPNGSGSDAVTGASGNTSSTGSTGSTGGACAATVGPQLRERTTIGSQGLVTLLPGPLPCAGIGVWIARFTLDSDPALDPAPVFGARYTGQRPLAVRIPSTAGRCSAAAVFFTPDAVTGTAATGATEVRTELARWPANSTAVVPGGPILRGQSSPVLAATIVGDPTGCSPGESVSTPVAVKGDCWTALPPAGATSTPTAVAQGATRFRRTTCGDQHTHEVYWAEELTTKEYLAEGKVAGRTASVWARRRADLVCARRSTDLELTHDVARKDIFLELLWPATLTYPPPSAQGWAKAQVVCLVRWQDGKSSNRHLLHR
jgi:hypothetical protein